VVQTQKDNVTLVYRSDLHLADQPPRSRIDDWAETLLGKVQQVGRIATSIKADGCLDGGDMFHVKTPSRNSHSLTQRVIAAHEAYPCDLFGVVGNHDVKYQKAEFLPESPLGVLSASGLIHLLDGESDVLFKSKGVSVRVVGIPYHGSKYDMERFSTIQKGEEDWLVAVCHCLASKKGGSMFEGEDILKYDDLVGLDPDVWCFGHWHKDQGIEEIQGKHFVNVGSLSRGSLAEDELKRNPACAVLKFSKESIEINKVPLSVKPVSEVFDLEKRKKEETNSVTVEKFIASLEDSLVSRAEGSVLDQIRALSVSEDIKERMVAYVEQAGAN